MLVLSRQRDESIIIGKMLVTITVLEVKGRLVRLGIRAADLGIRRKEVIPPGTRPSPPTDGGGYLVLSRRVDQEILIGDNIELLIVDIRGDKVRIGIEAPKDVPVHRQEVYEQIQKENALSQQGTFRRLNIVWTRIISTRCKHRAIFYGTFNIIINLSTYTLYPCLIKIYSRG